MERILFKEEQRFTQWWLWTIVIASFAIPMLFLISEMVGLDSQSVEYREALISLLALLGMGILLGGLFAIMKLSTQITTSGIRVKFPPLKMRWRMIAKEEILRYEVKQYSPIKDFGGWGYRKNIFRKKDAYNVKGNIGIQLYLKNGKTLLIGTQRKQAIKSAMSKLFAGEDLSRNYDKTPAAQNKSWFVRVTNKILRIFAVELALAIIIFGIIQLFNLW